MADPEPPPDPAPFPIRIVRDPKPPLPPPDDSEAANIPTGKRNDEFYKAWDEFLIAEPKRAKTTSRALKRIVEERKEVQKTTGDGLQIEENAAKSWEQAAAECKAKVAAIEEECLRLNQKYTDAMFNLEENSYCLQSLGGRFPKAIDAPPWIKRVEDIFEKPQFFIDGASATDVHQGASGDCWFLAALMAVSAKPSLIERLCIARNEKVGVYGFVFYRDGEWVYEVIDDKLFLRVGDDDDLQIVRGLDVAKKEGLSLKFDEEKLMKMLQKGGEALYFGYCKSEETWLPLIEKAYAKAHGDYFAIEGGFASEGIEDLTGGVAVVLESEGILDKDRFWREQLLQVNKKYLFGGGSSTTGAKGFVGGHAYAVLEAWEEGELRLLKLRNPWGEVEWEGDWSDGSKLWTADMMTKLKHTFGDDGVFWISYLDFLKHFPSINRVRLFDSSWSVGQQWTCCQIPWTVDYLDTQFKFTISERGPVVLVLAQPDDRYFYNLRGRYLYSLHFRVYREGDEEGKYIVRSMHNSGNEKVFTRSVSAEIEDLDPGTYGVVFKVTAVRSTVLSTAEEAIVKYAVDRKDKLLQVGRRFDYAQTKGNLKAMEEGIKRKKKLKSREEVKKGWRKARKMNKQERERARLRKQRVKEVMRERRKEFELKQRVRAKEKKEKAKAKAKAKAKKKERVGSANGQDGVQKAEHVSPVSVEQSANTEVEASVTDGAKDSAAEDKSADAIDPGDEPKPTATSTGSSKGPTDLSHGLQDLSISAEMPSTKRSTPLSSSLAHDSPSSTDDDDEEDDTYDSPISPPSEREDDDFSWDTDLDAPVSSSSDSDSDRSSVGKNHRNSGMGAGKKAGIFGEDPWQALCVLGLRVYARGEEPVKVRVVKAEGGS
ncbi:putative calpain family cysteine protease protein [Zymoseptoria brevis]|uniref:Putative calpain family cysteine protease protein n=1 Tax=Zymoseptoria brevis TaxID=1047168 RepID=A0A0F4GF91_9PEZI|nr:putative calpain family cysteine protease protein [Zymoseptoria brevis]